MNTQFNDDLIISQALSILEARLQDKPYKFEESAHAKSYLRLHYSGRQREEFNILFMDSENRLIANETMSLGTHNQAAIYTREAVRASIKYNASYAILAHNHPNHNSDPSEADMEVTDLLGQALALVGCQVVDHLVVGEKDVSSIRELDIAGKLNKPSKKHARFDSLKDMLAQHFPH